MQQRADLLHCRDKSQVYAGPCSFTKGQKWSRIKQDWKKMSSMISLDGYNLDKMDEIEQTLIDAFISQDEIDDADEFVQKNAPAEYIQYLKDYQKVKERFRREGILA